MRLLLALSVAVAFGLLLPAGALAHVGTSAPVATDFIAAVTGLRPPTAGIRARTVDGDQTLWLEVRPPVTVLVPGVEGEPFLRFDRRGVWVNVHSLTAQSDRIDWFQLRPLADPRAAPVWDRLTGGHAFMWHEHRLHLLEPFARGLHSAKTVGPWSVPLLVDGRRRAVAGVLSYRPPPSSWMWIGVACVLGFAGVALVVRRHGWGSRLTPVAAFVGVLAVWVLRVARELYGRPTVSAVGWIEVALTSIVGILFVYGLSRRDPGIRSFVAVLLGVGALYQVLTMLGVLTHSIALTRLPTDAARVGVAAALATGVASLAGGMAEQLRGWDRHDARSRPRPEPVGDAA